MAEQPFQLEIVTPQGVFLSTAAHMVELPGVQGRLGVLAGHQPLMTALDIGELRVLRQGRREAYFICGGFARIDPDRVSVMAVDIRQRLDETVFSDWCELAHVLFEDSYDTRAIDAACERARESLAALPAFSPAEAAGEAAAFSRESILGDLVKRRRPTRAPFSPSQDQPLGH
jgi:F-type H+-transporting ATPase subunit epsilon